MQKLLTDLSNIRDYLSGNIIDIRYLLEIALDKNQTWIWTNSNYKLNNTEQKKLEDLIKKRKRGIPFAYLKGIKSFYHLDFIVNEHTLIPRPETENIIDIFKSLNITDGKVLDLGTGSGIIAITLKSLFPKLEITAVDNNPKTLEVAKQNAVKNNVDIDFKRSNWFENIENIQFDIIISNPPYIAENDTHLQNLSDPIGSLTAKDNGLYDIKTIITHAPKYLNTHGYLLLEHGYHQQQEIVNLMEKFKNIQVFKDYGNQDRNILAQIK